MVNSCVQVPFHKESNAGYQKETFHDEETFHGEVTAHHCCTAWVGLLDCAHCMWNPCEPASAECRKATSPDYRVTLGH